MALEAIAALPVSATARKHYYSDEDAQNAAEWMLADPPQFPTDGPYNSRSIADTAGNALREAMDRIGVDVDAIEGPDGSTGIGVKCWNESDDPDEPQFYFALKFGRRPANPPKGEGKSPEETE